MENIISYPAQYWHKLNETRIQCDLCPHRCKLKNGNHGICFVRYNQSGILFTMSYGYCSGLSIDHIEKKPLYHFYPGASILSFGTIGCNLSCNFCQNYHISQSRNKNLLHQKKSPQQIAAIAKKSSCNSVAFTYNEPTTFIEYMINTAIACKKLDIKTVMVSSGYINPIPRKDLFAHIDAVNIDLKSFDEVFYKKLTGAHLNPVLDTIQYIKNETKAWLEITTLIIPGINDSDEELHKLTKWIKNNLGPEVPLHFSAFHPSYKMLDIKSTSLLSLLNCYKIAKSNGLHHVYLGNINNPKTENTYCSNCGICLIERERYTVTNYNLNPYGKCFQCDIKLSGRY